MCNGMMNLGMAVSAYYEQIKSDFESLPEEQFISQYGQRQYDIFSLNLDTFNEKYHSDDKYQLELNFYD